jgi:hypothetical protein
MSLARFVLSVRERLLQLTAGIIAYESFPRRLNSQPQYPSLTIVSISLTVPRHLAPTPNPNPPPRLLHPTTTLGKAECIGPVSQTPEGMPAKTAHDSRSRRPPKYSHDLCPSQNDRASLPIGLILRRIASLACIEGDVEVCMESHVTLFPVRLGLVRC